MASGAVVSLSPPEKLGKAFEDVASEESETQDDTASARKRLAAG